MSTNTELSQRITIMLQAKADQVAVDDESFDPERAAFIDTDVDGDIGTTECRAQPPRRMLVAVAGTALLAGLVVAVSAAHRSDEPVVTVGPTVTADSGSSRVTHVDGPPIASVQLASATVELHQDGASRTLCVRRTPGSDLHCSTGLTASVVVDDTWYVAVAQAQAAPSPLIAPGWGDPAYTGDPAMPSLDDQALSTETGNDAGWAFALATPPPDADFVWLEQGLTHTRLDRPTRPSG